MKTCEAIIKRVERLGNQKRAVALKLMHLQKSFETHNDRVDAGAEEYAVDFIQQGDEVLAIITNEEDCAVVVV